jgi:hypothetical protein
MKKNIYLLSLLIFGLISCQSRDVFTYEFLNPFDSSYKKGVPEANNYYIKQHDSGEIKFIYRKGFLIADVITTENRDLFIFSNNTVIKGKDVFLSYKRKHGEDGLVSGVLVPIKFHFEIKVPDSAYHVHFIRPPSYKVE